MIVKGTRTERQKIGGRERKVQGEQDGRRERGMDRVRKDINHHSKYGPFQEKN